jgi:Bacterial Ig-like domain (group 3)
VVVPTLTARTGVRLGPASQRGPRAAPAVACRLVSSHEKENLMSAHETPVRQGAFALLVGLLPLVFLASLLPAAPAVAAGEQPGPALQVTVHKADDPRYGDNLEFAVRSTGIETSATVSYAGSELATKSLEGGGANFSIPTLGRFKAGVEYHLDILVSNETSTGTSEVKVKPWFIGSTVNVASTTLSYSAPLFGDLVPTLDTVVEPSGADMEMRQAGVLRATYPIRADGTFALNDLTMTPGVYPDVSVFYAGDESYSRNFVNSGMFVGDLTVVKMPTTTSAGLSDSDITQGQELSVLASTRSADANTVADVTGDIVVSAAPADTEDFVEIARAPYPGGNQALSVSLDDFADNHSGDWVIRTAHSGTDISAMSHTRSTLHIDAAAPVTTTTELELNRTEATAYGAPVTATAEVVTADGSVPTGEVAFLVDGERVATAPVQQDGRATAAIEPGRAGARSVSASYVGGVGQAGSDSAPRGLIGGKATTETAVTAPAGSVPAGTPVRLRVVPDESTAPLTGPVTVSEAGREVATARLADGAGTFRVPALSVGAHTLTVRYAGDADTEPSSRTVQVKVAKSASRTTAVLKKLKHRKVRLTVSVIAGRPVTGKLQVRLGTKVVAGGVLKLSSKGRFVLVTKKLPAGKRKLVVRYAGSRGVAGSTSKPYAVRVS